MLTGRGAGCLVERPAARRGRDRVGRRRARAGADPLAGPSAGRRGQPPPVKARHLAVSQGHDDATAGAHRDGPAIGFPVVRDGKESQKGISKAKWRASQTSFILSGDKLVSFSTRSICSTVATLSRVTAHRSATWSASGSKTTSDYRPRIVRVNGATVTQCNCSMAESRVSTNTGRHPNGSGKLAHQTSP